MQKKRQRSGHALLCSIEEDYKQAPSVNARAVVERLLLGIPAQYLKCLGAVVLWDTTSFREHYGDSEKVSVARYIKTLDEDPPWVIEICVDALIGRDRTSALKIPFFRDLLFSHVLYHELGHHIHNIGGPQNEEPEAAAEKWRTKLQKHYMIRKYWFIIIPAIIIYMPFKRLLDKYYESHVSNPL